MNLNRKRKTNNIWQHTESNTNTNMINGTVGSVKHEQQQQQQQQQEHYTSKVTTTTGAGWWLALGLTILNNTRPRKEQFPEIKP